MADNREPVDDIERAMVAIRRSQNRRSLARLAGEGGADGGDSPRGAAAKGAAFDVLDAIEAAEQSGAPATVSGVAAALAVDQPRA
ncbi:MarR family transcriptional regulator, partial [Streptomyces sp. MCAF7]